jgi:enolase
MCIAEHIANSMIVKVNQVGTLTSAIEAAGLARIKSWLVIASHRSGETNDDWLADFGRGPSRLELLHVENAYQNTIDFYAWNN